MAQSQSMGNPEEGRPRGLEKLLSAAIGQIKRVASQHAHKVEFFHYYALVLGATVLSTSVISMFTGLNIGSLDFLLDSSKVKHVFEKGIPEIIAVSTIILQPIAAFWVFTLQRELAPEECETRIERDKSRIALACGAGLGAIVFVASLFA